mgnify:CR=1 FL=1
MSSGSHLTRSFPHGQPMQRRRVFKPAWECMPDTAEGSKRLQCTCDVCTMWLSHNDVSKHLDDLKREGLGPSMGELSELIQRSTPNTAIGYRSHADQGGQSSLICIPLPWERSCSLFRLPAYVHGCTWMQLCARQDSVIPGFPPSLRVSH